MTLNMTKTIAIAILMSATAVPSADAQFGLKDLVNSAKKEVEEAANPQKNKKPVSSLGLTHSNEELQRRHKNYKKTIAQGAGIGAIAGGIAGYALGGSEEAVAIGAAVGGVAGGAIGAQVSDRSNEITKDRKALNKGLKASRKYRKNALEMLADSQQNIKDMKVKIKALEADYLNGAVGEAEMAQKVAELNAAANTIEVIMNEERVRVQEQKQILTAAEVKLAQSQDAEMKALMPALSEEKLALSEVTTVTTLGMSDIATIRSQLVTLPG